MQAPWPIQRNNQKRTDLQGDRNNDFGYIRDPLMDIEAESCPPDLLHMKKGVLTKLVTQVVLNYIIWEIGLNIYEDNL